MYTARQVGALVACIIMCLVCFYTSRFWVLPTLSLMTLITDPDPVARSLAILAAALVCLLYYKGRSFRWHTSVLLFTVLGMFFFSWHFSWVHLLPSEGEPLQLIHETRSLPPDLWKGPFFHDGLWEGAVLSAGRDVAFRIATLDMRAVEALLVFSPFLLYPIGVGTILLGATGVLYDAEDSRAAAAQHEKEAYERQRAAVARARREKVAEEEARVWREKLEAARREEARVRREKLEREEAARRAVEREEAARRAEARARREKLEREEAARREEARAERSRAAFSRMARRQQAGLTEAQQQDREVDERRRVLATAAARQREAMLAASTIEQKAARTAAARLRTEALERWEGVSTAISRQEAEAARRSGVALPGTRHQMGTNVASQLLVAVMGTAESDGPPVWNPAERALRELADKLSVAAHADGMAATWFDTEFASCSSHVGCCR